MRDHIHQSNLIESVDSRTEDDLSMFAWYWLRDQPRLTQPVILELHKLITCRQLGRHAGKYRDVMVRVADYYPPAPEIAKAEMYGWGLDMLSKWQELDPKAMHIRFEKIHPFIDGNGRVGRMLMWWHELKLGKEPTLITYTDRWDYYEWFKEPGDAVLA